MDQIFSFISKLSAGQRAVIIAGFSLLFVFLIGLLIYSNIKAQDEKLNYTISANLTKSQVMLASSELDAAGIPFTVIGNGNSLTLRTNKENINVAKIKLLVSDTVTSKHTGWEIFDKSSLGTTNFENKVKYKRALEGELGRALESLTGILSAKVKIGQPKDSIFIQRKIAPTASAVLTLRDGSLLGKKQIDGIKNFIASAIPKLELKNIKLINQNGTLLEYSKDDLESTKYIAQEKYKKKLEENFENKIRAILEPFIGYNRVVAKVSVHLDFTKQDIKQEIFEPEGTIRSQQTTEITSANEEKDADNSDVAGVQSNIQDVNGDGSLTKSKASSEEAKSTINYEISKKIINQTNNAYAQISRIATAVTFDSTVLEKLENKDEFLKNINSIVEDTVGYKSDRGDKVTVKSFKFIGMGALDGNTTSSTEVIEDDSLSNVAIKSIMQDFGEYIQYLIASILLFIFYKKFILSNDVMNANSDGATGGSVGKSNTSGGQVLDDDISFEENSFDNSVAKNRIKAKVKNQILNNIEGLDEESAAKYEVLIEELNKEVLKSPDEMAQMIELLLFEGDTKFKS